MFLTIILLVTNLMGTADYKEPSMIKPSPAIGPNTKQEATIKSSTTQPMVWDELKSFTQAEKENTLIDINLLDETNTEAKQISIAIKQAWANGNYNYAFELFENLAKIINPSFIELGIIYNVPIIQGDKWGGDVRIGTMDSINLVALDFEPDSSRLFAVVASNYTPTRRYVVYRSTNGGASWTATQSWTTTVADAYRDIDLAVAKGFLFVADIIGNSVRVRRSPTSTGYYDSTRTVFTGTTADSCYDIAITSDVDEWPDEWWPYLAARIGGNVYAARSSNEGLTWDNQATIGTNAIGRIDICFAQGANVTDLYVPFFRANDSLYIARNTNFGSSAYWVAPANTGGTRKNASANAWPSVAAYGDTAMIVYEYNYASGDNDIYRMLTINGGVNWSGGYIFTSTTNEGYPNITGRKGKGWAAACIIGLGLTCNVRFRNSLPPYASPSFINNADLADTVARYNVCPAIEYYDLPATRWGVVYSSYQPYEWAWFDYNRTGIQEVPNNKIMTSYLLNCFPNPSRNPKIEFEIPVAGKVTVGIYDIKGSIVRNLINERLQPGKRTIQWDGKDNQGNTTAQGVYFVKLTTQTGAEIKKLLMLY